MPDFEKGSGCYSSILDPSGLYYFWGVLVLARFRLFDKENLSYFIASGVDRHAVDANQDRNPVFLDRTRSRYGFRLASKRLADPHADPNPSFTNVEK
jgi:hypothetical protein